MSGEDEEVIFTKKPATSPPSAGAIQAKSPQSTSSPSSNAKQTNSTATTAPSSTIEQPRGSPRDSSHTPPANGGDSKAERSVSSKATPSQSQSTSSQPAPAEKSKRRGSTLGSNKTAAVPPQLLDIQVSCRNLSSNSSVVALFEAKGNKSLEYVGHTEGIRHSHHPDFQTHLIIEHRKGTNQKVKFNVYTLPPVHTRVEEKMRIGSAYVYLDEIAQNTGLDLLIDLVHGYNAEKDKNNAWLKSHLLIKARIKEDHPEEERLAKVRATSLNTMMQGRVMTLYDVAHKKPPKEYLFFYRQDSELGAMYWMDLADCPGKKVPENFSTDKFQEEKGEQVIRLMDILAIYEGHQTQAYIHPTNPALSSTAPDRCFSIILADGSVDLQCGSVDEREAFMLGIHDILTTQAQKERDLENMFKFLVKCRNLPPEIQEGGLFIALSSRDTKGLSYEVVNKTGWLPSSMTPDFPKAMTVPYISDSQSLKFDLFHNSLNANDGVGTAIVVYKELKEHIGQMVMIPLRNMIDPEMDSLLQQYKSVMLIECLEHGEDDDERDEIAEEGDSDDESEEYYGAKLRKLREKNKDMLDANGYQGITIPAMPPPPPAPKVSVSLFNGYMLDKYAFNTKGCQRKMIFAAKDIALELKDQQATAELKVDTLNSPGPNGQAQSAASSPSASQTSSSRVIIPGNEKNERTPERTRLYWCKPGKPVKSLESSLKLSEVTNITVGKKTATLQRKDASKAPVECCVSLAWGGRTLDLVADTQDVRDSFVADLVYFLMPKSKAFEAYGQCGTGAEEEYEKLLAAYNEQVAKAEKDVRARLAAMGNNPYSELAGNGDGVNATAMPDLQAAMTLLAKLHDRGMEKLGLNPNDEFVPSKKSKSHPDIMSSLAALDDIFSELDARFSGGGGGGGSGTGGGTGDGVGSGRGGGNAEGGGGSGSGGGTGDGIGPGKGGGGRKGRKGRGGKGKGGGKGDGTGSGSDSDGEGGGGGKGKGKGGDGSSSEDDEELTDEERAAKMEEAAKLAAMGSPKPGDEDDSEDEKTMDEIAKRLAATKAGEFDPNNPVGTGIPQAPGADFVVGNAPPPPPMGPGFGAGPQARKLKQLHWDPLMSPEVNNTIFFNLEKAALGEEEEEDIDELFANHVAKKIEQRAKTAKGIALIDAKRAYNVEIGITRVKMTNKEIKSAILAMDPSVLIEEKAQILLDRVPTLEELAILKKYTGPTEELGNVEQFFMMMATIPMCGLRLECHLFRLRFPEMAAELKTKLKVMFNACKSLTTSNNLAKVYQLVLQVGNYLNAGTRKGNASGFKLASLPALSNTKSTDGKLTLLDYIVTRVDKQFKTPEEREKKVPFLQDIHVLKDAVNYDWAAVMEEHRRMKTQLKKIQTIVQSPPPEDTTGKDKFHSSMTSFYTVGNEEFKLLTKRLKRIMQLEDQLLAFFGETKDKTNLSALFLMLSQFTSTFEMSEMNLKTYSTSSSGGAKKKKVDMTGDGGVIDPRLGNNFAGMLQGVKLKSKGAKHLAGGYAGRKTQDGTTISAIDPNAEHVGADNISIDFGGGSDQGETIRAAASSSSSSVPFVAPAEFVSGSGGDIPMAPPPATTLYP